MKAKQKQSTADNPGKDSVWQKSKYSNLIRYVPSKIYYARFRVKGKLVWKSLKTDRVTVAKSRLGDMEKKARAKAERGDTIAKGKLLVKDAIELYKARGYRPAIARTPKDTTTLKPAAVAYYEQRIDALKETWTGLESLEIGKITVAQCERWADGARAEMAASVFNHTLSILRNLLDFGIKAGARDDNPAVGIIRASVEEKQIKLIERDQLDALITEIENSGSGWSKPCADLVRFLAFGGFRKSEAAHVLFSDCDFQRKQITVRGPETGLKNRKPGDVRTVPMIPDMVKLLERLKAERPDAKPGDRVMRVSECQKAIDRAAVKVGAPRLTHHDLRDVFGTTAIESGVDIPTVSRWLGHKDGGALLMRTYAKLRDKHSAEMAAKVSFSKGGSNG